MTSTNAGATEGHKDFCVRSTEPDGAWRALCFRMKQQWHKLLHLPHQLRRGLRPEVPCVHGLSLRIVFDQISCSCQVPCASRCTQISLWGCLFAPTAINYKLLECKQCALPCGSLRSHIRHVKTNMLRLLDVVILFLSFSLFIFSFLLKLKHVELGNLEHQSAVLSWPYLLFIS